MRFPNLELRRRVPAILRQRCPVCMEGAMFRGTLTMNERCPECGHQFEREQGFFQGAMYVSYALSLPVFALDVLILWLLFGRMIGLAGAAVAAMVVQALLVPSFWRYSRTIWAHLNIGTRQYP